MHKGTLEEIGKMSSRQKRFSIVLAAFLIGIAAGQSYVDLSRVAHAGTLEQDLPTLQGAHGALEMVQYDMQRAGYSRLFPRSEGTVRVSHEAKLNLVKASSEALGFQSTDGHENIVYRYESGRITRTVTGAASERLVLVEKASAFDIRTIQDGAAVSVTLWIPVTTSPESESTLAPA